MGGPPDPPLQGEGREGEGRGGEGGEREGGRGRIGKGGEGCEGKGQAREGGEKWGVVGRGGALDMGSTPLETSSGSVAETLSYDCTLYAVQRRHTADSARK